MNETQRMFLMDGHCPHCKDVVKEIKLESQYYTHRVLCLGCKRTFDDFTFGKAYLGFMLKYTLG